MELILLLHGSKDSAYVESVAAFARRLGLGYAFLKGFEKREGAVYVPVFVANGEDYKWAVELSGFRVPPLARWPGFAEYLRGLGADLYVFHGSPDPAYVSDVESLGLPYAFLEGEPDLRSKGCPRSAAPVVLTRGVIYNAVASAYRSMGCSTALLPPLFEQPQFAEYFSEALEALLRRQ